MKLLNFSPLFLSTILVGCGIDPNRVQADFEKKNALSIQRYAAIVDGARKWIFTILECQTHGAVPQRPQIGHNAYRPSRYIITKQDEKGGAYTGEKVQRIDYYGTTNERYHWSRMGSQFPKLTKPHWLIDDLTAYPKPNDQYIPNDQMCKKIDPNIL